MDKRTLKALKGSIVKWERILAGEIMDEGADNCPLCRLGCFCCPVHKKTGRTSCLETPYEPWCDHQFNRRLSQNCNWATDKRSKMLAQRMVDFLKSLLP